MTSNMVMTVRMDLTSMGLDEVALTSNTKIQHGPIMFTKRGVKVGLFAAESQLELVTNDAELNQWINELVAEVVDDSLMIGQFNRSYTGCVTEPARAQTVRDGATQ